MLRPTRGDPTAKCPKRSHLQYAPSACKKSTIENKRLYVERSGFPMSLMVSVSVSKVGKSSTSFVEPGAKINGAYYREKLLASMIPEIDRLLDISRMCLCKMGFDLILQMRRLDS